MKKEVSLAHNHEQNLRQLSDSVFAIDKGYKQILYEIAKRGPQNIHRMAKFVREDFPGSFINRRSMYRRIDGSPELFNMVEKEYIYPEKIKERNSGNAKVEFHLTLKGLLAVLATGINIEDTYLFQNLIDLACKPLGKKTIKELIKNYFKSCIIFFLAWHNVHGIQLTYQIGTLKYFEYFFANLNSSIPILFTEHLNQKEKQFFRKILIDYVSNTHTLETLQNMANPINTKYSKNRNEIKLQKSLLGEFKKRVKYSVYDKKTLHDAQELLVVIIQKWPYFLEGLHISNGRKIFDSKKYKESQKLYPIFKFINENRKTDEFASNKSNQIPLPYSTIKKNLEKFMSEEMAKTWALAYEPSEIMFGGKFALYPKRTRRVIDELS